jgi:septum formation protein
MRKIVLASTSPKRKEIFEKSGLVFEVFPSDYEEDMTLQMPPQELAKFLSKGKAESVIGQFDDAIIISADTFVSLDDKVIGKPHTKEKAWETLRTLSGRTHIVYTGFTVIDTKNKKTTIKSVETKVIFKELPDKLIGDYIENKNPLKYAGSYTLGDIEDTFIEKIEGDPLNILGFPLDEVLKTLREEFEVEI